MKIFMFALSSILTFIWFVAMIALLAMFIGGLFL
jgi:hypothetical protein